MYRLRAPYGNQTFMHACGPPATRRERRLPPIKEEFLSRKIKVIDMKDAEIDEQDGILIHRLVTTKVGSPDVTFGISVK